MIDVPVMRDYPNFYKYGTPVCATTDPEIFFPEKGKNGKELATIRRMCGGCDVRSMCLEWALKNNEVGIWGGTTERERRRMKSTRNRAQSTMIK